MEEGMNTNPNLDRLPPHLKQFIKPQNYEDYSAIDQAVWRYVMRKNISYLPSVSHESYLTGLEKTGISIEEIPSMYGMNRILQKIGWSAVAVDGFIPPNAFMEFQAYKVLVIASDIRQLENIEYTPAPDIIHEAAGHAPIIANPDYAEYLRRIGEIGAKAILSDYDNQMYEAVRKLSILKEAHSTTKKELEEAEFVLEKLQNQKVPLSEMAQIRNLHWWTVEYGLIGTLKDPKIYGAGLLSSIGESMYCMTNEVKKLPFTIDAIHQEFDITKAQPQLFVTPDFAYLMQVLEEFANSMALRKGGHRGLKKLIESKKVGTIELSTGLQISGVFSRMILNEDNEVIFFKTEGESALAYREKELIGHGISNYKDGFSSPLGKLKSVNLAIEDMSPVDLKAYNFYDGKRIVFEFDSGIKVEGVNLTGIRTTNGKLILIQFIDCMVTYKNEILFSPEDGTFDMAVGKEIISAFAGSADFNSFPNLYQSSLTKTIKAEKSEKNKILESLYKELRKIRETSHPDQKKLEQLFDQIEKNHPSDWLLSLELLEISNSEVLNTRIKTYLKALYERKSQLKRLIVDGMELLNE